MSVRVLSAAFTIIAVLSSCAPLGGSLENCATQYSGTFSGDREGLVAASLGRDGLFVINFSVPAGDAAYDETEVEAEVTEAGEITDSAQVDGTFEWENCEASGSWTTGGDSMTWTIEAY